MDIRLEAHSDHHKIGRHCFTIGKAHSFDAPVAKHRTQLGLNHRDIASALAQATPGFCGEPAANHNGARTDRGCLDNFPGVIQAC